MKLKITLPGEFFILPASAGAKLISILESAICVRTTGWGSTEQMHLADGQPTIFCVDDSIEEKIEGHTKYAGNEATQPDTNESSADLF